MPTLRPFRVTVTVQFPAWYERDGIPFDVCAEGKADAIRRARHLNARGGQVHSQHGRSTWRAVEISEAEFVPADR